MKNVIVLFVMIFGISFASNAQKASAKTEEVTFQTSAKCGMCKMRLEKDMSLAKGVKEAKLDLDSKKMTIAFNPKKTNKKKLQKAIAKIGYDADELVCDKTAHDALPGCCQKSASAHIE